MHTRANDVCEDALFALHAMVTVQSASHSDQKASMNSTDT